VKALKKLLLGETWVLPLGLALLLAAALILRPVLGDAWRHAGGFIVLAGAVAALLVSVARSG
jgi:hypothetical protein